MGGWDHGGGFSLDAAVRIGGADRAGRERLLRYCARPPFDLAHLQQHDAEHLAYLCPEPRPGGPSKLVLTPLTCPFCLAEMRPAGSTLGVRIIAFITEPSTVRQLLDHLGESSRPPRIAPAHAPPLWEAATAAAASNDPASDHTGVPAPAVEFDQRITW